MLFDLNFSKIKLLIHIKKNFIVFFAERKGFEPSIQSFASHTHFPSARLRPLGHLSFYFKLNNLFTLTVVAFFIVSRGIECKIESFSAIKLIL
jgi:hypothetical protein